MKTIRSFSPLKSRRYRSGTLKRRLAVAAILGAAMTGPAGTLVGKAPAADCDGAISACDGFGHADASRSPGPAFNGPIYKTLDAVAGGIEKVFGLDKRHQRDCDARSCDDGCDAAMMQDLSMPVSRNGVMHAPHRLHSPGILRSPHSLQPPTFQTPGSLPAPEQRESYQRPAQRNPSSSAQPKTQVSPSAPKLHMTKPRISDSPQNDYRREAVPSTPRGHAVPEQPIPQQLIPTPEPDAAEDSIFDSLSNPFDDDTVYVAPLPRQIKQHPVRAANYQESSNRSGN